MSLLFKEQEVLAAHTTLGVGGPANFYVELKNVNELKTALTDARLQTMPLLVLGGGSNVVIADVGWPGLVLRYLEDSMVFSAPSEGFVVASVGAGLAWDTFVAAAVERGLAGVECLSGIPGLVGSAPIQNIGAYGQEVKNTIVAVQVIDRQTRELTILSAADCAFSYRMSNFKTIWQDHYIVTRVDFKLEQRGQVTATYEDLQRELAGKESSLSHVREAVLAVRRRKSMVLDPADPNTKSVGSFFMNPIVDSAAARKIQAAWVVQGNTEPLKQWSLPDGRSKFSAAALLQGAGYQRGDSFGSVGFSTNHILALVNKGQATAADIAQVATEIRQTVHQKFGVRLEIEPMFIGF